MYTVGLKRRWWFGYKEYDVTAHSWDNGRLILNQVDGSQIHLPGVRSVAVKVYPDFWIHLHSLPRQERLPEVGPQLAEPAIEDVEPPPHDHVSPEVKKRAAERVRGILQSSEFQ